MKQVLALCIFLLALPAGATKVRPVSVGELAQSSELVVYGQIQLAQIIAGDCGVRYVVKIEEAYKGRLAPDTAVLFSSEKPLLVGSTYVLFLSKDSEAFDPIISTNSFGPQPDSERVKTCQRNRPLYTVNVWGNGALKVTSTYASKAKVAVFNDFMILMPKGTKAGQLDPTTRYDIDRDTGSIEFGALRDLLQGKRSHKHAPNNSFKPNPHQGGA
ncbi:hypothetical protein EON80_18510 [bacterium]|nr:MAG: hypothetical protein EON80_18510 [bacterium]